jgi:hypothetical protein
VAVRIGQVSEPEFSDTVAMVRSLGLAPAPGPVIWRSRTALLVRP